MIKHIVQQGESVISLSKKYGISVEKIWNHPDNQGLKNKERTHGILFAGDELTIPDKEKKEVEISTNKFIKIRYRRKLKTNLNIKFNRNGKPRSNEKYVLKIEDQELKGNLDNDGRMNVEIPVSAKEALLYLGDEGKQEKLKLKIGYLDPVSEVTGIKQRMRNMGMYYGKLDDSIDDAFLASLKMFQKKHNLSETGEVNEKTKQKVKEAYGS